MIVEQLNELLARANLGPWDSWSMQYRVLAVVVGLLAAYWVLQLLLPVVFRVLRPFIFLAVILAAVWALFPTETCSIEILSKIPKLCVR
ncbi:MAG: hypothetical protein B7Y08_27850 [Rhodospirillales bacterium 24-66-33]|nr:MAG: hypothetical protein B7Y57_27945 [Rhodospirillales bacterium 35-66-84]OYZ90994.1 MAG: hypothetical protein B7Y08_27850 [Rhodospirillales bacterium 24-66-33]OZB21490.1 MAG: hypothetical protein B7X63_26945 [Rhodospirillales bacterium 39-66-50]